METTEKRAANFIEEFINEDLASGRFDHVRTRFPPEPNGYLHIGHAKALCIDFGIAKKYGGKCNLRFDDTNPTKEDAVFVEGIQADIEWLGYKWDELHFASDFFGKLYEIACDMIRRGVAYVDDQTAEEMRLNRGTLTKPGTNSPYRDRSVEENLDLFERMKNGEFAEGTRVLRAKIDMAAEETPEAEEEVPEIKEEKPEVKEETPAVAAEEEPVVEAKKPIAAEEKPVEKQAEVIPVAKKAPKYAAPQRIIPRKTNAAHRAVNRRRVRRKLDDR